MSKNHKESDITGVAQSVMASFDDPRCEGETVCPTTPLLFTCTVTGSMASLASVRLPSGEVVNIRSDDTTAVEEGGTLPDGVVVQSHSARIEDGLANYMLALTIESASILNGNNVTCDDRTLDPTTANASCHVSTGIVVLFYKTLDACIVFYRHTRSTSGPKSDCVSQHSELN